MRWRFRTAAAGWAAGLSAAAAAEPLPQLYLPPTTLTLNDREAEVQMAADEASQQSA